MNWRVNSTSIRAVGTEDPKQSLNFKLLNLDVITVVYISLLAIKSPLVARLVLINFTALICF